MGKGNEKIRRRARLGQSSGLFVVEMKPPVDYEEWPAPVSEFYLEDEGSDETMPLPQDYDPVLDPIIPLQTKDHPHEDSRMYIYARGQFNTGEVESPEEVFGRYHRKLASELGDIAVDAEIIEMSTLDKSLFEDEQAA